jgi:resolvase-like protein
LEITRWFEEQESASHTGRHAFLQMLSPLRRGVAQGVIIHKIDRSTRNLEDWADVGRLVQSTLKSVAIYKIAYRAVDEKPEITWKCLKRLVGPSRRFSNFSAPNLLISAGPGVR